MEELEERLAFIGKLEPEALVLRPTGRTGVSMGSQPYGRDCWACSVLGPMRSLSSSSRNLCCPIKASLLLKTATAGWGRPMEGRAM